MSVFEMNENDKDTKVEWEDRCRYRTKHREVDLKLVRKNWPVKFSSSCGNTGATASHTHVSKASSKLQKKYKRAVQVHQGAWIAMMVDLNQKFNLSSTDEQLQGEALTLCERFIKNLRQAIPKMNGKILVDFPTDMRRSKRKWGDLIQQSISLSVYWTVLTYREHLQLRLKDYRGAIETAIQTLSILPPISDEDPSPHPMEIQFVAWIAFAHAGLGNFESAATMYRCYAAAKRYLTFYRDNYHPRCAKILQDGCDDVEAKVALNVARSKIQQGAPRPFFDLSELHMYEKELGAGMYSNDYFKCCSCGVARDKKRLNLCSGCRRIWYCSTECQVDDWNIHKRYCKGRWRKVPFDIDRSHEDRIRTMVAEDPGGVALFRRYGNQMIVGCIDPDTDEVFDALTDRPFFAATTNDESVTTTY